MRKPEPVELVQIHLSVMVEAVCAALIFGALGVLLIIYATPAPV
jgi:hypothetical protein